MTTFYSKQKVYSFALPLLIIFTLTYLPKLYSEDILKLDKSQLSHSLQERWELAKSMAHNNNISGSYWIGYCISKTMERNSYIGSFDTRQRNTKSLFETIYGYADQSDIAPEINECCGSFNGTMTVNNGRQSKGQIIKKIAVLTCVNSQNNVVTDVKISNMSLHVDLEKHPLLWIESSTDHESITLLTSFYNGSKSPEIKEELVRAFGLHQYSGELLTFFKAIVQDKAEDNDVREEAVFWIGQFQRNDVLPFLTTVARNDYSEDVREKAVFSIYEVDTDAATDSLISLSRKGHDKETRSKALFWLSERASEKALKTIKEVIDDDDEDTEVQRQALFALTQMDDDENNSVAELIDIAKTHPNRKIRKEAIFWLGQSENPKAIDALVEIVKK